MRKKIADCLNPKEQKMAVEFSRRENMRGLVFLILTTVLVCCFSIAVQMLSTKSPTLEPTALELIAALCCLTVVHYRRKDPAFEPLPALYLTGTVLAVLAIMGDTYLNRGGYSFAAIVLSGLFPMLIVDLPWRLLIYDGCLAGFYITAECRAGSGIARQMNVVRCIAVTLVALLLSISKISREFRLLNQNTNIQKVAEHDPLTGVFNRAGGVMLIRDHISDGHAGTMIIMDVDDFKHVNDSFGHQTGDRVLKEIGSHLLENFRSTDVGMRVGGDEFLSYAVGMVDRTYAEHKIRAVCEGMHEIILDPDTGEHASVSMGCVINDGSYPDYEMLYHKSDHMLYRVKEAGKDGYKVLSVSYRGKSGEDVSGT